MPQVVQAKCPHCRMELRIPADWLVQAMRCRHCQQAFQVRPQAPVAPAPAVAAPPAPRAPQQPAAPALAPQSLPSGGNAFAFDQTSSAPPVQRPRTPPPGKRSNMVLAGGVLVLVLGGVFAAAMPYVLDSAGQKASSKQEGQRVARGPALQSDQVALPDEKEPPAVKKEPPAVNKEPPAVQKEPPPATKKPPVGSKTTSKQPVVVVENPNFPVGPKPTTEAPPPLIAKLPVKPKTTPPKELPPFPRRALAISVNDYLFANPLMYGTDKLEPFPGSAPSSVLRGFATKLHIHDSQRYELSDQGKSPTAPTLPLIKSAISQLVSTSRAQDRVTLLFTGHVVEGEKEAFLVPLEGALDEQNTLLPLAWVYEQLKSCKACQKVLILDVCRLPARGAERPGSEKMGKVLGDQLQAPPDGVQVWSSCIEEQHSVEFESGSVFLQALSAAMLERLPGFQEPSNPLPLDVLVPRVNQHLVKLKVKQTSRLSGKEMEGGAPVNPEEAMPPALNLQPAEVAGGSAGTAIVQKILDEINSAPAAKASATSRQETLRVQSLPPFPAKVLMEYEDNSYGTENELMQKAEMYPLRAAVLNAKQVMRATATKFQLKEVFTGSSSDKVKKAVFAEQKGPALSALALDDALRDLLKAGEGRDKETSKRWLAHYDYTLARLKARYIFLMEYNFLLAQIRTDSLPALEDGFMGYRISSSAKIRIPEAPVKTMAKGLKKEWDKIIADYPDTPWALMARRERLTALGLEWRSSKD